MGFFSVRSSTGLRKGLKGSGVRGDGDFGGGISGPALAFHVDLRLLGSFDLGSFLSEFSTEASDVSGT